MSGTRLPVGCCIERAIQELMKNALASTSQSAGGEADDVSAEPMFLRGPSRPDLLRTECLWDILATTARRQPEHPALVWGSRTVTYGELCALGERAARALAARGMDRCMVVGLLLPRGADLWIAQAAITGSGAAWLPFDAETPLERVRFCLQSARAVGLVTCRDWLTRFAELPVPAWALEDLLLNAGPGVELSSPLPSDPHI